MQKIILAFCPQCRHKERVNQPDQPMIKTTTTAPQIIAGTIAHWEREIAAAEAQIKSGEYPRYDDNQRSYIKECRRYIKRLKA